MQIEVIENQLDYFTISKIDSLYNCGGCIVMNSHLSVLIV